MFTGRPRRVRGFGQASPSYPTRSDPRAWHQPHPRRIVRPRRRAARDGIRDRPRSHHRTPDVPHRHPGDLQRDARSRHVDRLRRSSRTAASRCPISRPTTRSSSTRPGATPTAARGCIARSTRSTARSTSTASSRCPTRAACMPCSSSPTSRRPSPSQSRCPSTGWCCPTSPLPSARRQVTVARGGPSPRPRGSPPTSRRSAPGPMSA